MPRAAHPTHLLADEHRRGHLAAAAAHRRARLPNSRATAVQRPAGLAVGASVAAIAGVAARFLFGG